MSGIPGKSAWDRHLDHNWPDTGFMPDMTGKLEARKKTVEMSELHASILEELKGLRI